MPSYSLTGDLLAYQQCGLQYRYQNRGSLPPSKPVQLWFGQFIHGVMEEAYRSWLETGRGLPWADEDVVPIVDLIIRRLAARGIYFQRYILLAVALQRAFEAINTWGPYLFPLIAEAELLLQGVRDVPRGTTSIRDSPYYEVAGVVDVITSVQIELTQTANPIAAAFESSRSTPYEVLVDYKGMRRPTIGDRANRSWESHRWQVLTYAWLRTQQNDSKPVRGGALLYLNELAPGVEDMDKLCEEVLGGGGISTDVMPREGDLDLLRRWPQEKRRWQRELADWAQAVRDWWRNGKQQGQAFPTMPPMPTPLSPGYRLARSFRPIPVDLTAVQEGLQEFDAVVSRIESSVAREFSGQPITQVWEANPQEETCTVCDFRTFCPAPGNRFRGAPAAP